jgi:hypothetical protein
MNPLKLLGLDTKHQGQHGAGTQRGKHAKGATQKPAKSKKPTVKKTKK